jgi:inorganic pyrophosphatase
MPKSSSKSLSRLRAIDRKNEGITVVIETPKGSPNKYDYNEDCAAFRLAAVMPEGTSFPYDFGFIPSTLGEDGDPLDVLVLLDAPVVVGCVITVRLIGAILAEQRETDGKWVRNDRLIAVANYAHMHQHIGSLDDLRPHMLAEIEGFFAYYNQTKGKEFKKLDRCGPKKARKLVERGIDALEKS